ncbi:MAG: DUF1573 domain-containing protein [Gemmataceae bacterium]|nr:DUF1573 domain-containing protein [Gemmataceae bacterium]
MQRELEGPGPLGRAIRTGVGLSLLAAAWFKATGRPGGVVLTAAGGFGLPFVWLLVAVVIYELLLAGWLLSGVRRAGATLTAMVTFAGFAALSAHAGWMGRASCGCLGEVAVAPWWTFGFDLGAVCALAVSLAGPGRWAGAVGGVVRFAGCWAVAVAGWTAAAVLTFGSSDALVAYLRGYRVVPLTSVVDVGSVPAGQPSSGAVVLRNTTASTVTVVGGTSDCSCTYLADLPLVLPPGCEGRVVVQVGPKDGPGEFLHYGHLWTDAPEGRRTIPVTVVGRSVGP